MRNVERRGRAGHRLRRGAGRRGLLDVYRPADGDLAGAPVLLQVHGGGWTIGSKDQQGIPLMQHLAAKGWVCVAINYRLSPRDAFPAHIVDVKRAIAWIREHIEEYGGDPVVRRDHRRLGRRPPGRAGRAHRRTTRRTSPASRTPTPRVQAAVPHYGVYDFAGVDRAARAPS